MNKMIIMLYYYFKNKLCVTIFMMIRNSKSKKFVNEYLVILISLIYHLLFIIMVIY